MFKNESGSTRRSNIRREKLMNDLAEFEEDVLKMAFVYKVKEIKVSKDTYKNIKDLCVEKILKSHYLREIPSLDFKIYFHGVKITHE